ncbi:FlaG/FlaF family flagellin (archaellin) [Methanomicrobium sp. W14]|uniref:type IV pilin n=1 Tax=Methanomicrobium sp. W14 TaxID=2817839 RepID=UPI001AE73B0E|nr:type IV pilin N-terminal domain-containing protein [Methanomicrobium sp. W14]MBP2134045.1 FlaG/FlaF family flagellin (archaellin) [Methanomicrobium sp. W14]
MNFLEKKPLNNSDSAVSPVVGVMLMLVVTIIIAAVVSGFAGGLVGGTDQKAPLLTMDVKISNTGTYIGSGFSATVTSVSDPIRTKDIKIATSWKVTGDTGSVTAGGSTASPFVSNVKSPEITSEDKSTDLIESCAPYGFGPGVNSSSGAQDLVNPFDKPGQQFGNYSLVQGTGLTAYAYGSNSEKAVGASPKHSDTGGYGVVTDYTYTRGGSYKDSATDAATAVLGNGWEKLRTGDTVNVKVIHIPTGKVIFEKNVAVTEG